MSFHANLSNRQTVILTALATTITTTSLILSFQALRREHRTERLKREVGEDVEEWEKSRVGNGVATAEEIAERLAGAGGWKGKGREYDEGLIREQVSLSFLRTVNCFLGLSLVN